VRACERRLAQLPAHGPYAAELRKAPASRHSEAGATGLEPATSGVTGRRSNQLSYAPGAGTSKYGKKVVSAPPKLLVPARVRALGIDLPEVTPNPAVGEPSGIKAMGILEADPRRR
jgi:hypothetical protein